MSVILKEGEKRTWRETCPCVTLSVLNHTRLKMKPNAGLRGKMQATNRP